MSAVRDANAADLDAVAEMAGTRSKAEFGQWLGKPEILFLIAEWGGSLTGFLVAQPGPTAAAIDEFSVEDPRLWASVGQSLLRQARARLKDRGIVQVTVAGGDAEKIALLEAEKFSPGSGRWMANV